MVGPPTAHLIPKEQPEAMSALADAVEPAADDYLQRQVRPLMGQLAREVAARQDPKLTAAMVRAGTAINRLPTIWAGRMAQHRDDPAKSGDALIHHLMRPFDEYRWTGQWQGPHGDALIELEHAHGDVGRLSREIQRRLNDQDALRRGVLEPAVGSAQTGSS